MKEPRQQETLTKEENLSLLKRLEKPPKKYIYISVRLPTTAHESIQQSKRLTSTYQEKDKKVEISQRNVHDRGRVATIRAWKF